MTDNTTPREWTEKEVREQFIGHLRGLADYWSTCNIERTNEKTGETEISYRLSGLLHSVLVTIDGGSGMMPKFLLAVDPHPDDKQFNADNGTNWFPPISRADIVENVQDLSGGLHEMLYSTKKKDEQTVMPTIEIFELREAGIDAGDLMGYYCKGHPDRHLFAKAANKYTGADLVYDCRYVRAENSRHVWWRVVPMHDGSSFFQHTEPHARGAFAATVCECVADANSTASRKMVREFERGASNGFSRGLNWALRWLEHHNNRELVEKMLAGYREKNPPRPPYERPEDFV